MQRRDHLLLILALAGSGCSGTEAPIPVDASAPGADGFLDDAGIPDRAPDLVGPDLDIREGGSLQEEPLGLVSVVAGHPARVGDVEIPQKRREAVKQVVVFGHVVIPGDADL